MTLQLHPIANSLSAEKITTDPSKRKKNLKPILPDSLQITIKTAFHSRGKITISNNTHSHNHSHYNKKHNLFSCQHTENNDMDTKITFYEIVLRLSKGIFVSLLKDYNSLSNTSISIAPYNTQHTKLYTYIHFVL